MKYRDYGSTGIKVSEIGMGTSRLIGGVDNFNTNVNLVDRAIDLGINYFDTAPTYASGLSEKILGQAFLNTNKKVYVTSKSMVTMEGTSDEVLRRIENSLKVLHVDKINFFHMWSILSREQYAKIVKPGGPLDGAIKAKEMGLIEHICFSAHCNGDEIEEILDNPIFDGVTLGFNAINYKHKLLGLKAAGEKGVGVAIMNPLAGGLIPRNPDYFSYLCDENEDVVAAALRFVLGHKEVSSVLIGAEKEDELVKACSVSEATVDYNLENRYEKIDVKDNIREPLCTMCNYCAGCPQGIKINYQMGSYNELILSGFDENHFNQWKKMYFNAYPFEKINCIGCGRCERKCTQHISIINRINVINNICDKSEIEYREKCAKYFDVTESKTTAIWGMTYEAESLLMAYKTFYKKLPESIYLIDGNEAKWGKGFLDTSLTINGPDLLNNKCIDRIIIASSKYEKEIRNKIKEVSKKEYEISLLE